MSPAKDNALAAYAGHEKLTAARMKWWGVYLVREQRRLQTIADRVRAQEAARAIGHITASFQHQEPGGVMDDYQLMPDDDEAPEEWLAHLDAETTGQDPLDELDAVDDHVEANGSP